MINKKYFYDQMGYEMEPEVEQNAVAIEPSAQTFDTKRQKTAQTETASSLKSKIDMMSPLLMDDYIEIVKADIKPVMYNIWNLNDTVYIILKALQDVSKVRYYGVSMLVNILRGVDNKRVFDNNLDKLTEFGAFKEMPREVIQSIVEWLIKEHYILKTKEKYPVLHSTYKGLHYRESMTEEELKKLQKYLLTAQ